MGVSKLGDIKKYIKHLLGCFVKQMRRTKSGEYLFGLVLSDAMMSTQRVWYNDISLTFSTPNKLNKWRVNTFATKEPETLDWINGFKDSCVFWDIGANVGLYSCYAALAKNITVVSFEPSVFNLELLARNISLNKIGEKVIIMPLPLSDSKSVSYMRFTSTDWGGALSTFGKDFGWDGKAINGLFEYRTIGLSMEDVVTLLGLPTPDYIKMDVDGLEHFILAGGSTILRAVQGILIEVNDNFQEQAISCKVRLEQAGLVFKEKCQSELMAQSGGEFSSCHNQIWVRN
jgi:FkbM family methyltransferase